MGHSEKWHERKKARLREPFKNTKRYNYIPTWIFIFIYIITKDYYHGWAAFGLSFLDVSIFFRLELSWAFLFDALGWAIGTAAQVVAAVFMIKSFKNIIACKHYVNVSLDQAEDYLGSARAVTFTGPPGCGKTFSGGANFAPIIAEQRWEQLQSDYLLQKSMLAHWISRGEVDKLQSFRALEEAYVFYAERIDTLIPCLISSLPLQDMNGRFSYVLTPEVQAQVRRIPEYSVLYNDESGTTQGADVSKDMVADVKDFYRFNRHFGDLILINSEQGTDGNAKAIRKVTDYNIMLLRQETVMRPYFLERVLSKAKARFFKRISKDKLSAGKRIRIGESLYYAEMYIKTIGFRVIPYRFGASEQNSFVAETGKYVFPRRGWADYDARAFRNLYKAKDLPIDLEGWTSLLMDEQDLHRFDGLIVKKKGK
ncbi:MAG: hypothetical protein J6C93_07725 [Clostridia bacterium]|nr:hypothetical protein [Clostridia bacterium]